MAIKLYRGDLPADLSFGPIVAIDTETMGLNPHRDRLCLVQLSAGDGNAHLVQIPKGQSNTLVKAPNLAKLLADPKVLLDRNNLLAVMKNGEFHRRSTAASR